MTKNNKIGIASHYDADGISSVVLLMKAMRLEPKDVDIFIPDEFGGYKSNTKYMLDMTPKEGYDGICIDHHDQHPEDYDYTLIYDNVPATRIVYDNYNIPEGERWKVAVGVMGDYSPEAIPTEVWDDYPILRDYHASTWQDWDEDGGVDVSSFPLYKLLSSPINAPCRNGYSIDSFKKLYDAKTPFDILYGKELLGYKDGVNNAMKKVIRGIGKDGNYKVLILGRKDIVFVEFECDKRVSGIVSTKYYEHFKDGETKTVVAINKDRGKGSIRGPLTGYLNDMLNDEGFKVGGHSIAAGISLNDRTIDELINVLSSI